MSDLQIRKAGKWNPTIMQGSTFTRTFRIQNLDVTAYSFRGMVKKSYGSQAVATYSFNEVSNTTIEISLSSTQTAAIPAGDYIHDIEIYDGEGYVARIIEGRVKVTPEVTR